MQEKKGSEEEENKAMNDYDEKYFQRKYFLAMQKMAINFLIVLGGVMGLNL